MNNTNINTEPRKNVQSKHTQKHTLKKMKEPFGW